MRSKCGTIGIAEIGNARILLYNTCTPVNRLRPVRRSQQLSIDGCIALRSDAVKKCTKCTQTKPLSDFYKCKSAKDGLTYWCADCMKTNALSWSVDNPEKKKAVASKWIAENRERIRGLDRKWKSNNREKILASGRRYRENNTEMLSEKSRLYRESNKEKIGEQQRVYRKANPEKTRATKARWEKENPEKVREKNARRRKNHPEKVKESARKWLVANPEKVHEYNHARKARIKGNGGVITAKEWKELRDRYGKCLCCGRSDIKLTLDHVTPLAKGGTNTIDNAQPLCQPCNSSKGAKIIDYRVGHVT